VTTTLVRHKTQGGGALVATVPRGCNAIAVRAIDAWLALAGVKVGEPVLRRVPRASRLSRHVSNRRASLALSSAASPSTMRGRRCSGEGRGSVEALQWAFTAARVRNDGRGGGCQRAGGHESDRPSLVAVVMGYVSQAQKARISPHCIKGVGLSD
jgi:hypothetical protein